jgi:hypothetical protein
VDYTTYHHDDPNVQKERLEAWMWAWKHVRDRPGGFGQGSRRVSATFSASPLLPASESPLSRPRTRRYLCVLLRGHLSKVTYSTTR